MTAVPLRLLIVDDEAPARARLRNLLADIRMPRLDGIGLVQHLAGRATAPAVIFTTAYDQYAVSAFDLNAIDYLLKPVRAPRLLAALQKLPRALPDAAALRSLAPQGRLHLHSSERGRILLVPLADILFLRAELKYVTAQTREREYLIEESLTHLEQEFGERFIRVHRNCLVARTAIVGVERDNSADGENHWWVLLRDANEKLPVSRRQWPLIKALLKEEA